MTLFATTAAAAVAPDFTWVRQFGTSGVDLAYEVAVDPTGNVYAVGLTDATLPGQASAGLRDAFVRKHDPAGNELWVRQFGTSADDNLVGVTIDPAGNVYVAGLTKGALSG